MSNKERAPNDPTRQHYVPEAYLKAWVDPATGQLWRCRRSPAGKLHDKRVAPKGTGYVRDLYTFSSATPLVPVPDPYFVETEFFKKIDNDGGAVLAILRGPGIGGLDAAGRRAWTVYLNALMQRRPDMLSRMDAFAKARADRTFEHLQAGSDANGRERFARLLPDDTRAGMGRNFVRQHMMERIEDEAALVRIEQQRWVLVNNTN